MLGLKLNYVGKWGPKYICLGGVIKAPVTELLLNDRYLQIHTAY